MRERKFTPTREEDTFQVGRLDDEAFSGVYLSPAYMDRLREVMYAAALRLEASPDSTIADAVKNLLGITRRLTRAHAEQLKAEGYLWTEADRAEAARLMKDVEDAFQALGAFHPPGDDSDDA
jgi:hypothetical protein